MYLPSAIQADISRGMSRIDPFSERRCCAARTWQERRRPAILRTVHPKATTMDEFACDSIWVLASCSGQAQDCTTRGSSRPRVSYLSCQKLLHTYKQSLALATQNTNNTRGRACLMLSSFCNNWLKFFPASVWAPSMSRVSSVRWLFAAGPAPVQVSPPAPPRRDCPSASRSAFSCIRN